jgi:glutathione S-transferase
MADMKARNPRPFAPPYLVTDGEAVAQVAHVLRFLGARHGLAPDDEPGRRRLDQFQLTATDFIAEVHQVHHPVGNALYYEDQKREAARFAEEFREKRMPKYLGWFEHYAQGEWIAGTRWSYGDTSAFQLIEGLRYMFPKRMAVLEKDIPKLVAIHDRIAALPGIAAYCASERRLPFNTSGIFRHYPELDAA